VGDFDVVEGFAVCPRHGSQIDIRTGAALTLPAVFPVDTFPVVVEDGVVKVDV
jgi:3-phenylpropionate/trans-cinnamate dioxygenase ferredoxin subunit